MAQSAERRRRRPHRRETKGLAIACLALPALLLVLAPLIGRLLGAVHVVGFPLAHLLAAVAPVIGIAIATARFVKLQHDIDRWHGAHEDL